MVTFMYNVHSHSDRTSRGTTGSPRATSRLSHETRCLIEWKNDRIVETVCVEKRRVVIDFALDWNFVEFREVQGIRDTTSASCPDCHSLS